MNVERERARSYSMENSHNYQTHKIVRFGLVSLSKWNFYFYSVKNKLYIETYTNTNTSYVFLWDSYRIKIFTVPMNVRYKFIATS